MAGLSLALFASSMKSAGVQLKSPFVLQAMCPRIHDFSHSSSTELTLRGGAFLLRASLRIVASDPFVSLSDLSQSFRYSNWVISSYVSPLSARSLKISTCNLCALYQFQV